MALAIDGTPVHNNGSGATLTVSLTTPSTNDYIIVCVLTNATSVTSVSSVALGAFTRIAQQAVSTNVIELWAKFSTGTLSSDTITVTPASAAFTTVDAFGVSGSGQTSLVFDAGGPQTSSGPDPIPITTVNPNTMVIATFREGAAASPTAGSTFSQISGADFMLTEWKPVPTATTTSCTQTVGAGGSNGIIVVAIVQAVVADVLMAQIWL